MYIIAIVVYIIRSSVYEYVGNIYRYWPTKSEHTISEKVYFNLRKMNRFNAYRYYKRAT